MTTAREYAPVRDVIRASDNIEPLVDTPLLPGTGEHHAVVRSAHRMYEHLIALWAPGVIEAASDLGVFDRLAAGPATADELAAALSTNPKATRILLDGLSAYDVVERSWDADGHVVYILPDEVYQCVRPDGLFSLVGKIAYDRTMAWGAWRGLAETVRTGALTEDGEQQHNQISAEEYGSLVRGINFWAPPVVHELAARLRRHGWGTGAPRRLLDIGCGTGIYSHLLLREFAELTADGVDVAEILPLAVDQAARLDVTGRFHPTRLDFADDDWGTGYDAVLFVNIFHLQTPAASADLARRAAAALSADGLVAIVDHIVDEEHEGSTQNRFFRLFATSMMATGGGDAYTVSEYDEWLGAAGLRRVALIDTPMHRVLLARRSG